MTNETEPRRIPVLSIISGAITLVNIVVFVILVNCMRDRVSYYNEVMIAEFFIAVFSLVLVFFAKREGLKMVWIPLLVVNVIVLSVTPLVDCVGSLRMSCHARNEEAKSKANSLATLDHLKEMFEKNDMKLYLYDENYENDPYRYYDYDGTITQYFLSLDFNLVSSDAGYCSEYFPSDYLSGGGGGTSSYYDLSKDYRVLRLSGTYSQGFLHGKTAVVRYYVIGEEEAAQFKQMVNNEIQIQRAACAEREAEVRSAVTIEIAAECLLNQPSVRYELYGDAYLDSGRYFLDPHKAVLNYLKALEPLKAIEIERPSFLDNDGFEIWPFGNSDNTYWLFYHKNERCLEVRVNYRSPYDTEYYTVLYFQLEEEDGNALMEIVNQCERIDY